MSTPQATKSVEFVQEVSREFDPPIAGEILGVNPVFLEHHPSRCRRGWPDLWSATEMEPAVDDANLFSLKLIGRPPYRCDE
jgi:hypothetical protein